MLVVTLAQAATEYVLIAASQGLILLQRGATAVIGFVSTPRGIVIASAGVVLLAIAIGRKHRY